MRLAFCFSLSWMPYAVGVLCGGLRREGRALARALETRAAGAGPRDDVAHLVGERHNRVVERGLDVGDAHPDLLAFSPASALAGRGRFTVCLLFRRVSHA